jgi:hypothetical protein
MSFKYFFEPPNDEIVEENKKYDAHSEEKEVPMYKCDHKGKLSFVPGGLRCKCGAGWQGSQLKQVFDYFNKGV